MEVAGTAHCTEFMQNARDRMGSKEVVMRKMWVKIVVGLLVVLGVGLGIAFMFGIRGMKETLGQQINGVDISGVADGTYRGKYEAGRFKASVEVTVKDHKIVAISPLGLNPNNGIDKGTLAVFNPTIDRVLTEQTPDLDAISGSTATIKSLLKAVENALLGAGGSLTGK